MTDYQTITLRLLAVVGAGFALAAADQTNLGPTVGNVLITKHISGGNLGLTNTSASRSVSAIDLRVSGDEPVYTVTGQIFCKNGARLVEAQAIIGNVILHDGQPSAFVKHGQSPKLTSIAGRQDADVSIPVRLSVIRKDAGALVDLSFNPAGAFLKKLKAFTSTGGSPAAYLREDQAFEMPVNVNLIGWCRMPPGANSVLAGKTYAGIATRSVPVSILYTGDLKIVDRAAVEGPAGQRVQPGKQPRAPAKQSPPRSN